MGFMFGIIYFAFAIGVGVVLTRRPDNEEE